MRPPVLVTRPLGDDIMTFLAERCDVETPDEDRAMPREELLERLAGNHGLLAMLTDRIDDEALDAAGPSLRVVANHAVGYDNVDVAACTRRGVVVTNTPDVLTDATADMTWGLILGASRRIGEGDRLVRSGMPWEWSPGFMLGREVTGKTLGIVGFGRIGRALARRAVGFSMRVLAHTRTPPEDREDVELVGLDELLAESDIVSIHLSLSEETRHRFGARELGLMKETAVLVNTSRGPIVDEAALADALANGEIAAAGLDVYEHEPEVHPGLFELENVVLAPHLGSATVETRAAMGMLAARNLVAVLLGERPPTPVNPEALG
ncbi:MAG TPA: D-glycerate dehydrogenase [Actinomycetota bacterium]|nr:D-glycerate dehydrogenase [Actinomycetota bacterium]